MALLSLKKNNSSGNVSDSDSSQNEHSSSDEQQQGNSGWADSIAKVLSTNKPKTKKTLVLSRAKKIKPSDKNKVEVDFGFEVEGEIKKEDISNEKEELSSDLKQPKNQKLELRVKPTWKDIERERALRKVATKGVVQLFNAVRIQQKDLQHQLEEAGPLDSRKEAVLKNINKRKFLDVLMGGKRSKSEAVDNPVKNELKKEEEDESSDDDYDNKKKKSEWNVLRDDFMTNKKNKHWDEEDEDDENQLEETDDE
ncbi:RRP15-like protein [Stomoxys calcitrans]|uniref:RRP15-like protein n=1 Tax=Stomoxys calcitrans TaxID=35570 RepID=A0A1I8PZR1_STOCA|nr:RRP15-like protein [Stomoxys calcitrans]